MSLLVPAHVHAARHGAMAIPGQVTAKALDSDLFWTTETVVEQAKDLGVFPQPRGHKVALLLIKPPESLGGVVIPEEARDRKTVASTTGLVLAMGPRAYQDPSRFDGIPDCEIGEVVLIPKYCGQVIRVPGLGGELHSIVYVNDDQITAGWGATQVHGTAEEPAEPRAPVAALAAAQRAA